jgi:hypothetical protein
MDSIRRALLASNGEETTVTALAVQHGFNHFGRFATHNRRAFGERPSKTLQR